MSRFKTGVRYLKVNYNVNKDKRVVACHLVWGINMSKIPYIDMLIESDVFKNIVLPQGNVSLYENDSTGKLEYYITIETVGFADCCPEDEFDTDLGKKIALTRAQRYAFTDAANFYNDCMNIMLNCGDRFSQLFDNCANANESCIDHIDKLISVNI